MDSSASGQSTISRWFANPSVRALTVAAIVLAILAMLHVNQTQTAEPMKELLEECKLQNREIQKLQLAFGQAGLNDFQVKNGVVWVPQSSHGQYLATAVEKEAIPNNLQGDARIKEEATNPFLTRAQQENIDHARRNAQVREMVQRLPFVDQAWIEMDRSKRRHAFDTSNSSAVVSVRSTPNACLSHEHVATIKTMIAGAVAELATEHILVIDLESGLALKNGIDELTDKQRRIQEIAFNQKRFYQSRLQDLLSDFPNLAINVSVDVQEQETVEPQRVTAIPDVVHRIVDEPALPSAGANGVASIEPAVQPRNQHAKFEHVAKNRIHQVAHEHRVQLDKQLKVVIEVPAATVFEKLGEPVVTSDNNLNSDELWAAEIARQTENKFEQLKATIVERVLPIFPNSDSDGQGFATAGHSLSVQLDPLANPAATRAKSTAENIQQFFSSNWPSVAVLGIGLVLLSIVTRRPNAALEQEDLACVSEPRPTVVNPEQQNDEAEVRLSQLIEEDPDSAAKIIETWIRDAA